jgi:hypothetical protein
MPSGIAAAAKKASLVPPAPRVAAIAISRASPDATAAAAATLVIPD